MASLENKPLEGLIDTVRAEGVCVEDCECSGCSAFSELVVRMRCVRIAIAARQPLARIEQALTGGALAKGAPVACSASCFDHRFSSPHSSCSG